jgi:multisubunit Na+/H+ antiporter MnhB subunit
MAYVPFYAIKKADVERITLVMRLRRGELRPSPGPLRRLLRPPGRQTNQALLVVLLFAFGTGVATVAIGSPDGAWVAIGHGICGMAVVLLRLSRVPLNFGGGPVDDQAAFCS